MPKKTEDKLKNLVMNWGLWPEEVEVGGYISPVAKIKVVWVWWGWQNAVNRMIEWWLEWVDFIAVNTDSQALYSAEAEKKINIWKAATKWLGAGSSPEVGQKAAEESSEEIKAALEWSDMVFITCWLGWWTWTWASPVIAEIAKWLWALTVWVVTKPFGFEWQKRSLKSIDWLEKLKEKVDTLIVIPNDRILSIIDKKTPLLDAFSIVDEVLNQWVQWVSDLITMPGLINVDFADVRSVMQDAGSALMWIWYGSGENRAVEAARSAIDSPLLELSIAGARWVLFNITWGTDLSMFEVDEAAKIITETVDPEANIIFWATINDNYTWELKITVVATGFDEESNKKFNEIYTQVKAPAFWRKGIGDSPKTWIRPISKPVASSDDLDVPTFLRKKVWGK